MPPAALYLRERDPPAARKHRAATGAVIILRAGNHLGGCIVKLLFAVLAALLAAGMPAQASVPLTMGQLLARCSQLEVTDDSQVKLKAASVTTALDAGKCWGHLEAYLDLATVELSDPNLPNATHPLGACPPAAQMNFAHMVRMFMEYARSHPADLQQTAAKAVSDMLREKYPCRRAR